MASDLRWRCTRCDSAQYGSHRYCSNCGKRNNAPIGCGGCLWVLLLIAIGSSCMMWSCFYLASRPTRYEAAVSDVSWERTIEIERNDLRPKEGPKDKIPADAVDVRRKGKTQIYTYKVREWALDRTLRADGKDHIDIRWPVETSDTKGLEADRHEREARRERYRITMRFLGDRTVRFQVPDEATFRKYRIGSEHVLTMMDDHVLIDGKRYEH